MNSWSPIIARTTLKPLLAGLLLLLASAAYTKTGQADIQGGTTANLNGRAFEDAIERLILEQGIPVLPYSRWQKAPNAYPPPLLLKNVPYENIFGRRGLSEFVLIRANRDRVRIEAKFSQGPGSHDEKLVYTYLNAVEAMPEPLVLIIVGGGVWREGSLKWLKTAARTERYEDPTQDKEVRIMDLSELDAWLERSTDREKPNKDP